MSATPRPWAQQNCWWRNIVPADHASRPLGFCVDAEDDRDNFAQRIATVEENRHRLTEEQRANAELIVRAVNCHDDLLAALKATEEWFASHGDSVPASAVKLAATIHAAIALAEAREP